MTTEERVAAYFDREMTPSEQAAFENELSSDMELKREFDFQNDIVEGLKLARKAELKAMLNNVPVGGPSFTGTTKWLQYFSAAIITAFVGFGIYYFWPKANELDSKEINIETPVENNVDQIQESETNKVETEKEDEQLISSPKTEKTEADTAPQIAEEKEVISKSEESSINTESIRPTPLQGIEQEESSDPDAPANNLTDKTTYREEPITAEVISDIRKYNFHYKFEGGKLMLYGDFNETYEILDFIQNGERTVYLYYGESYYSLGLSKFEITALEKISDQTTISNLEQKRKSR